MKRVHELDSTVSNAGSLDTTRRFYSLRVWEGSPPHLTNPRGGRRGTGGRRATAFPVGALTQGESVSQDAQGTGLAAGALHCSCSPRPCWPR